jgi:hypothetical protein
MQPFKLPEFYMPWPARLANINQNRVSNPQDIVPDYPHATKQLSDALSLLVRGIESVLIPCFHSFRFLFLH